MAYESLKRLAVSDAGFVFDPATGHTFTMSKTAAFILELLKQGRESEEVVTALTRRYEVDSQRAERDLLVFLGQLRELRLLPPEMRARPSAPAQPNGPRK